MEKCKSKLFRWPGVLILIFTLALVIPLFTKAEDGKPAAENYTASGDPNAAPAEQAPVFTGWVAVPEGSDNGQTAAPLPEVIIGESVSGGDVGDAVVEQPSDISPVWERLEALSPEDKGNAAIEIEAGGDISTTATDAIENAESLWNSGVFAQAIAELRVLEESGVDLAVGISWKTPKAAVSADWTDTDVRIGTRTVIKETHLDFDAQNGNQFAVLRYTNGSTTTEYWSVNISTDNGETWQETYEWFSNYGVPDVSAAVVDDYLWVGYLGGDVDFHEGRMRRFFVSNGLVDSAYGWKIVFDKGVLIKEIALSTNADDNYDSRVYYYAILDQLAPVATAAAAEAPEAGNPEAYAAARQAPIDMGDVEVSAPVTPGSFDGDVRDLPRALPWQSGDPVFEVPEGQLPNGQGDGWEKETNGEPPAEESIYDPVLETGGLDYADTITPGIDFEGMSYTGATPPDTVGDVGPNHYIQMVNASYFQIWDKNGNTLAGPTRLDSLWTAGGPCGSGYCDPIVVYDPIADRWVMSEFADTGNHMCVYVSKTADPVTGGWWLYDFPTPYFPDYPKYGVWPDAYYVSTYEYPYLGVYALDRANMLNGAPATSQRFSISALTPSTVAPCTNIRNTRILPSDLDGATAPPAGSPNYFFRSVEHCQDFSNPVDRLEIFEFDVDWTTPNNSSFTLVSTLTPADFTLVPCSPGVRDCIPQPGTTRLLDALSNRPMRRLQYRNFGGYETLVTNQAIDTIFANSGVRWYELRRTGGAWGIHQQGTYSPDSDNRWMGSIAMDRVGNMALGYSVSSTSVYPSIRYTGRLASDTPGTMPESEVTLLAGATSQTYSARWGDYSAMSVDPSDDCTFWYTQQYIRTTGTWGTRVGSFAFDECTSATNLVFYWSTAAGTTWNEQNTGVSNAERGLDATWNENHPTDYYEFASYIASDNGNEPIMVLRWDGWNWDATQVLSGYTGFSGRGTSISAYEDTVICAYEHSFTNGTGIRYNITYNGGASWSQGWWDPDPGHAFYNPDVTCRGGQGSAIVYDDEAGAFDPVWFRYRDHYSGGAWDAEVAQINDKDGATAWPNRIEWLPPSAGYAYGAIYISWDPDAGTPYFDRSDIAGGGFGDELAVDFGASGLWHHDGSWSRLSNWNPGDDLAGWSNGLAVDFDGNGLWNNDGSSWSKMSNWDADSAGLSGWSNGLAVDFGGSGLWNNDGSSWSRMSNWNPDNDLTGWSGGLAVDFGGSGLWNNDGSSWSKLSNWNADSGGLAGWSGGLAVDFNGNGLWNNDGSSWSRMSNWNPDNDLAGWPGGLAVDFGGNGLWNNDGSSWTRISNWNPEGMTGVADGLVVDFDGNGVWKYDGSSWSKLSNWNAENMSDCDLN